MATWFSLVLYSTHLARFLAPSFFLSPAFKVHSTMVMTAARTRRKELMLCPNLLHTKYKSKLAAAR